MADEAENHHQTQLPLANCSKEEEESTTNPKFHCKENPARKRHTSCNLSFKCPFSVCSYSTRHKANFKRHVIKMHESPNNVFKCCDQRFYSRMQYRLHLNAIHSNGFLCHLCQQRFVRRSVLNRHFDGVHSPLPHTHQCSKCSYSSSHKANLKRHISAKHFHEEHLACKDLKKHIWRPVPELFSTAQCKQKNINIDPVNSLNLRWSQQMMLSNSKSESIQDLERSVELPAVYLPKKLRVSRKYSV